MSEPVQCAVSFPDALISRVDILSPPDFPVTIHESPGVEIQSSPPIAFSVTFPSAAAQLTILPQSGPAGTNGIQGPPGAAGVPGAAGEPGAAGTSVTPVVLTLAAYLALSAPAQLDATKWYVIPKTS